MNVLRRAAAVVGLFVLVGGLSHGQGSTNWVIRTADGLFLRDKGGETTVSGESVVAVTGVPNARLERYDAGSPNGRRAATAQEITDFDTARKAAQATRVTTSAFEESVVQALFEELEKKTTADGQTPRTLEQLKARVATLMAQKLQ